MRQTACYLSAATGGLQETMFIYACRSQALADTRSPHRAWTSQLTEFQPVGRVHEQAFHAAGILMLVLMLLIPGLHKAPQQALLTLPYWQHCLQFSERWLELAWTTGSFKILHPRESSSHNEDYRSTGKRPSPRDPPSLTPGYSFPPGRVRIPTELVKQQGRKQPCCFTTITQKFLGPGQCILFQSKAQKAQ